MSPIVGSATFAQTKVKCKTLECKILRLNPRLTNAEANTLAHKIKTRAKKYEIDANLALAILQQESSLQNVITYKTVLTRERFCEARKCYEILKETKEAFDMGIAQININTAVNYKLDLDKLFNKDVDYTLDSFFIILQDKMKMCYHLGKESFSCYHSINSPYRELYVELVSRYLN